MPPGNRQISFILCILLNKNNENRVHTYLAYGVRDLWHDTNKKFELQIYPEGKRSEYSAY
jgi:hypothetical protein